MSIINNINLTLKLGFTKISINKNFPLLGDNIQSFSYTGSGKTVITYLLASTLRLKRGIHRGVVLHLLPLNEIIKEKSQNALLKTGSIMMSGKSTVIVDKEDGEQECESDFDETDIESGDIQVIVAHAESFFSQKGAQILKCLIRKNLLLAVVCDEFHKVVHWSGIVDKPDAEKNEDIPMREGMKDMLQQIRAKAPSVRGAR